ncbi:unnamed protein product, partial [Rotaria magnacalcarata]
PITGTTTENIEQVRHFIDDYPYITVEDIQEQTDLSHGNVKRMITDHLKPQKITARYIPKDLTDPQRAERVRLSKHNLGKFQQGIWHLCDVITGDESWFRHKQIDRKISSKAWVGGGDAPPTVVRGNRPHAHQDVSDYLESEGLTIIPHPANSPDLPPCDFWLFDLIKDNLTDQYDSESIHDAVIDFMNSLNRDEQKTVEKWTERMQLCVDNNGDYFEHLMK